MSPSAKLAVRSLFQVPRLNSHRGKEASKFQFDLTIERIHGASAAEYSLKWSRGVKTARTQQFVCDPSATDGVTVNQNLSLLCTLYRSKGLPDGATFEGKDSKISLISHKEGKKEKTVGKVHFNLAEFAGVPTSVRKQSFVLNSKTSIEVTIASAFMGTSDDATSSIGSAMSGLTQSSGDRNDDKDDVENESNRGSASDALVEDSQPSVHNANMNVSTVAIAGSSFIPAAILAEQPKRGMDSEENFKNDEGTIPSEPNKKGLSNFLSRSRVSPKSVASIIGKAKVVGLEAEVEHLQKQLTDARKETKKALIVNQMSEDQIRELREKLEYSARSSAVSQTLNEKELGRKVHELQAKIASSTLESQSTTEKYETRIKTYKSQIDTLERMKSRLERDKVTLQDQLAEIQVKLQATVPQLDYSVEGTGRDKLLKELSQLKDSNERLTAALAQETKRTAQVERETREAKAENVRLNAKIDAHEGYAAQVKATYEELSRMYTDLRSEHIRLRTELTTPFESSGGSQNEVQEKSRFSRNMRTDRPEKDREEVSESRAALLQELTHLKEEVQELRRHVLVVEKLKHDGDKLAAGLKADLQAARIKITDAKRDEARINEVLESTKSKYLLTSEQLEDSLQRLRDKEIQIELATKRHRDEISKLTIPNVGYTQRLELNTSTVDADEKIRQGLDLKTKQLNIEHAEALALVKSRKEEIQPISSAYDDVKHQFGEANAIAKQPSEEKMIYDISAKRLKSNSTAADAEQGFRLDLECRVKQLEIERAEAVVLAENRSAEVRRMSAAYELLERQLEKEKVTAEEMSETTLSGINDHSLEDCSLLTPSSVTSAQENQTSSSDVSTMTDGKDARPAAQLNGKRNRSPEYKSGYSPKSDELGRQAETSEVFISSSEIRKLNLIKNITDERLLDMLVETKMKLAVSEEEKLVLEHTIHRIRRGDKKTEDRLVEHANSLAVKLTQPNMTPASKRGTGQSTSQASHAADRRPLTGSFSDKRQGCSYAHG